MLLPNRVFSFLLLEGPPSSRYLVYRGNKIGDREERERKALPSFPLILSSNDSNPSLSPTFRTKEGGEEGSLRSGKIKRD